MQQSFNWLKLDFLSSRINCFGARSNFYIKNKLFKNGCSGKCPFWKWPVSENRLWLLIHFYVKLISCRRTFLIQIGGAFKLKDISSQGWRTFLFLGLFNPRTFLFPDSRDIFSGYFTWRTLFILRSFYPKDIFPKGHFQPHSLRTDEIQSTFWVKIIVPTPAQLKEIQTLRGEGAREMFLTTPVTNRLPSAYSHKHGDIFYSNKVYIERV